MFSHPTEFVRFKASPHLSGIELYSARLVDHAFAPHAHESYSLGAIETGVERFRYKGAEHVVPPDTLVTLNADEIHTGQAESEAGWTYQMLYLEPATLRAMTGSDAFFPAASAHDPELARAYRRVFARMWHAPDDVAFVSELTMLLDAVLARYGANVGDSDTALSPARMRRSLAMRRVLDCIEANLAGTLRIDMLAAEAGLSLFHFVRVFVATFNCTPQQYVQARRTLRAKQLLALRMTPADAAGAAGMSDQSHLNRWFKRAYGVTPAQYQQQIGTRPLR